MFGGNHKDWINSLMLIHRSIFHVCWNEFFKDANSTAIFDCILSNNIKIKTNRFLDQNSNIVALGLGKLLMHDLTLNPVETLTKMILKCFNLNIEPQIRNTISDFLEQYVKISEDRCQQVFDATIQCILTYTSKVNQFMIFGTMLKLLSLKFERSFELLNPYHLAFLHFFADLG